jgi:hypothetical protein
MPEPSAPVPSPTEAFESFQNPNLKDLKRMMGDMVADDKMSLQSAHNILDQMQEHSKLSKQDWAELHAELELRGIAKKPTPIRTSEAAPTTVISKVPAVPVPKRKPKKGGK